MEANSKYRRAMSIMNRLSKLSFSPQKLARVYYPFRKYALMRRVIFNDRFEVADLEAWEQALANYKNQTVKRWQGKQKEPQHGEGEE